MCRIESQARFCFRVSAPTPSSLSGLFSKLIPHEIKLPCFPFTLPTFQ
jgi:hypothetical protein